MSIDVTTKTIVTTKTVEKIDIISVDINMEDQTIRVHARLIDVDQDNEIVGTEYIVFSGSDFSSIFSTSNFNSLVLSTLGYTQL